MEKLLRNSLQNVEWCMVRFSILQSVIQKTKIVYTIVIHENNVFAKEN